MNGIMVNLYRYPKVASHNLDDYVEFVNHYMDHDLLNQQIVTFGQFDYMTLANVVKFDRYRDVVRYGNSLPGRRQNFYLYPLSEGADDARIFFYDEKVAEYEEWGQCKTLAQAINLRQGFFVKNKENQQWEQSDSLFCTISMLSLKNEILRRVEDMGSFLKAVRRRILDAISGFQAEAGDKWENIDCEVFGAFNTSEIAILWLSDQYQEILSILDRIKHMKISLSDSGSLDAAFFLTFSVVGINSYHSKDSHDEWYREKINQVKGKASLQISIKDGVFSHQDLKKYISEILSDSAAEDLEPYSAGEYDVNKIIEAKRACELIIPGGALSHWKRKNNDQIAANKDFLSRIIQTNTKLLYNDCFDQNEGNGSSQGGTDCRNLTEGESNCKALCVIHHNDSAQFLKQDAEAKGVSLYKNLTDYSVAELQGEKSSEASSNIYARYRKLRKKLELFPKSVGAIDTLDLLYTDYESNISSSYNEMWVQDFQHQFSCTIDVLGELFDSFLEDRTDLKETIDIEKLWNNYNNIINNIKQQIYHLSQANRLFFELPSCHLQYTGQLDFILHAYYGLIKTILEIFYRLKAKEKQSELVPLLTVNNVPNVTSYQYDDGRAHDIRVITFNLPGSLFFDLPRGAEYLIHEVAHYIVPNNRDERNQLLGYIICGAALLGNFQLSIYRTIEFLLEKNDTFISEKRKAPQAVEDDLRNLAKLLNKSFTVCLLRVLYSSYTDIFHIKVKESCGVLSDFELQLRINYVSRLSTLLEEFNDDNDFESFFDTVFTEFQKDSKGETISTGGFCFTLKTGVVKIAHMSWKDCERSYTITEFVRYLQKLWDCGKNTVYAPDTLSRRISVAFKEAGADLAMISLSEMTVESYLVFAIQCLRDMGFFKPEQMDQLSSDTMLRFSSILDYLIYRNKEEWIEEDLLKYIDEEEFVRLYIGACAARKRDDEAGAEKSKQITKDMLQKLKEEANNWLKRYFVTKVWKKYKPYTAFREAIFELLKRYDIRSLLSQDGSDPERKIQSLLQMLRDGVFKQNYNLKKQRCEAASQSNLNKQAALFRKYDSDCFKAQLQMVQAFYPQAAFRNLADMVKQNQERTESDSARDFQKLHKFFDLPGTLAEVAISPYSFKWKRTISSATELTDNLQRIKGEHAFISQEYANEFWYRGQEDVDFVLLPSLLRGFDMKKYEEYSTLSRWQRAQFEQFKSYADGAPEIIQTGFTTSDYLSLMQHYQVVTNFMDWSEDALTALYFALEPEMTGATEKTPRTKDASFYILDPYRYNTIRARMIQEYAQYQQNTNESIKVINKIEHGKTRLPNLSVSYNEQQMNMFLLGDDESDWTAYQEDEYELDSKLKKEMLHLPICALTSRLNPRIRAQSGIFLVYNLYSPPSFKGKGENKTIDFDYLQLEKIQQFYLNHYREYDTSGKPFLYKLCIKRESCTEIANWLRAMGISTEKIYPELSNFKGRIH